MRLSFKTLRKSAFSLHDTNISTNCPNFHGSCSVTGRQLRRAVGLDNLLYTPDADFSCFADLALTSPEDYYREGQGSLLQ